MQIVWHGMLLDALGTALFIALGVGVTRYLSSRRMKNDRGGAQMIGWSIAIAGSLMSIFLLVPAFLHRDRLESGGSLPVNGINMTQPPAVRQGVQVAPDLTRPRASAQ